MSTFVFESFSCFVGPRILCDLEVSNSSDIYRERVLHIHLISIKATSSLVGVLNTQATIRFN